MTVKISLRRIEELELEGFLDRVFYDEALSVWAKALIMDEKTDDLRLIAQLRYLLGKSQASVAERYEEL